jgi:hypothetical protein
MTAAVALFAAFATVAVAASAHFKKGGSPVCTISGGEATCSGSIAGLGNQDVVITENVQGFATFNCVSPGGNASPGQNKVPFQGTTTQVIPSNQIKNGNLSFSVTSPSAQPTATAEQAGCPNPNWTTTLASATVTSITLTISQGGQTLFTCSASGSFSNGQTVPLSC